MRSVLRSTIITITTITIIMTTIMSTTIMTTITTTNKEKPSLWRAFSFEKPAFFYFIFGKTMVYCL